MTEPEIEEVWRRWRSGQAIKVLAREMRRDPSTVRELLKRCGGVRPAARHRNSLRLSLAEREEISRGLAAGDSLRAIARCLGRAPSTISREVSGHGGRFAYRALPADRAAWARVVRPKPTKLSQDPKLAQIVAEKLTARWSPQQIAGWLARNQKSSMGYVSHETSFEKLCPALTATAVTTVTPIRPDGPYQCSAEAAEHDASSQEDSHPDNGGSERRSAEAEVHSERTRQHCADEAPDQGHDENGSVFHESDFSLRAVIHSVQDTQQHHRHPLLPHTALSETVSAGAGSRNLARCGMTA
ncbi:helix-turn-helix domain-containing protein [Nocardia sp. NPDC005825]|uniref:helix-turn-helix domain-containing protein n=1 Tax=Nocardia sp. NPDC005825 TaxID=3155452 RepID=UPI0033C5B1B4